MSYVWNVLSMICPVYEMYCIWNVLYMKCHVYEMSYVWNVLCMKCPVYEMSCLWKVLSMKCPVYEIEKSCLLNGLSMKCPIYCFVIFDMFQHHFYLLKRILGDGIVYRARLNCITFGQFNWFFTMLS